ncbi:MAG: helix-turn-helix transcriptional regulator [Clostridia bacterium]|nr:helix-turn-helix transcriptional regulator [Clostridia bacterium]
MDILTKRLRDTREDRDLTQQQIANLLQMKYQQYQNYESGKREIPLHHLKTLCKFYNITPEYFMGFTKEPKPLPKR